MRQEAIAEAAVCGPMQGCSRGWSPFLGQSWCITTVPRPWLCFCVPTCWNSKGGKHLQCCCNKWRSLQRRSLVRRRTGLGRSLQRSRTQLDRQILQLSKEVCDLQAQRPFAVARLRNSTALGVLDSMQAIAITWTPWLLGLFFYYDGDASANEAILLQQVVGEDVSTCCRWLASLFNSSHRH